jgi:hypothetical protein
VAIAPDLDDASCVQLAGEIPLSAVSAEISSLEGRYSSSSDRFVFQLSSASTPVFTTPAIGPWSMGKSHHWHLSYYSEEDHLASLGLTYTLVKLKDRFPGAQCLDGSSGAYYLYGFSLSHLPLFFFVDETFSC